MPDVRITIKNLPQIKAAFRVAPVAMRREMVTALNKSVLLVEGQSKINTPVDTGRLRASTGGGVFKGGSFAPGTGLSLATPTRLVASVGPTVDYARFVHEGTRYMRARPFLRDAVESKESTIQRLFTVAVQNVMNEIGRRV